MMTYTQFRDKFKSVEKFRKAFGRLTEEEARALISAENCATFIKAQMFSTWESARAEYEKRKVSVYDHYQALNLRADEAFYVGDYDKYDLLAEQAAKYRDENFSKEDWEHLIEETNNIQAKIGFTKAMNKLFPE
jgi:hypothetical protein